MIAALFDERVARRMGGAGLVLLLHLIVIAFLLRATLIAVHVGHPAREGIVWFVFPKPAKTKAVRIIPAPSPQSRAMRFAVPRNAITTAPIVPNIAAHGDLHALLFDCDPENFVNLSPEQRARCGSAPGSAKPPSDSEVYAEHATRSNSAAHWARGVARKHEPLLLPCASPYRAGIGLSTVICVTHGLINGFDLDNQPGYDDKPEPVGVPNGGDPPAEPPK